MIGDSNPRNSADASNRSKLSADGNSLHVRKRHSRSSNVANKPSSESAFDTLSLKLDDEFRSKPILASKSLLDNAAEEQDFNTIKQGLNVAFGTVDKGQSNWFPMNQNVEDESLPLPTLIVDSDNVPAPKSPVRAFSNPFRDDSSYLHLPTSPRSNLSSRDLEQGTVNPALSTPKVVVNEYEQEPPLKISNLITEVSNRISGTGASSLSPIKSSNRLPSPNNDDVSIRSIVSPLLLSANNLSTSIHMRSHKGPTMIQSIQDLDDVSVTNVEEGSSTSPTSVAFEHVPVTNIANPWKPDLSSMYLFGNSLGIFSPGNKFRQLCHKLLTNKLNNTFFLVLLLLQTGLLSYRQWNPSKLHGYVEFGYNWADYVLVVINSIYTIEMFIKIIAYGFYDDEIMFKELNLPYPHNMLKTKLLEGTWITVLKDYFRILFTIVRGKAKVSGYKKNVPEYYMDEIELQDQPQALHHKIYQETNQKRRLTHADTFLLPHKPTSTDKLHITRAYIRNSWHRIDFISIVSFWISLFLSFNHYDAQHNILIFRALSCIRILRLCNLTRGTSLILEALKVSIPELVDVVIFIGCFGLFFGIIGVQSFKSSFRRHCVWTNPNDPTDMFINNDSYCGSYLSPNGVAQPYIFANGDASSSIKGFRCPINSRCETLDNPHQGTVNFDNVFNSLEQVFIVMSANTFTDIMYMTMNSDSVTAAFYFVFAIFIMTVWLLNVFIAMVVSSFNVTLSSAQRKSLFGTPGAPVSMHEEVIADLKNRNRGLRVYYTFEFVFPILIICDLVAQCLRTADMSRGFAHTLYRIEASYTILFLVEIIVRFCLHLPDWRLFFKLKRNRFDLFLAIITSIIIISPIKTKLGHAYYWLTVFQIMRVYRVVMATSYTRNLWLKIMGNIQQLVDLTLFFFVLTFLVSIIYCRFFEGVITLEIASDAGSDANFDFQTLPNTFVGLYTITSTENWTTILYLLQGYQTTPSSRVFSAMFLIGWFLISNMVILNIFIAVIAGALHVPEAEKKRKQLSQFIENITASIQHVDNESGALSKYKNKFFKRKGIREEFQKAVVNLLLSGPAVHNFLNDHDIISEDDEVHIIPKNRFKRFIKMAAKRIEAIFSDPFTISKPEIGELSNFDPTTYAQRILSERNLLINKQNEFLRENPRYNKVFYVMGPRHLIRRSCQRMVNSSYGERIDGVEPHKKTSLCFTLGMFFATIALVVSACYVTPLYRVKVTKEDGVYNWTFWLDVAWLGVFSIEFIIRVLADGLVFTPNAYFRSSWNTIDFMVLGSLWIEFIAYLKNDGGLSRFISGFRALRALRLLTISEAAKNNFHNTIISGGGVILNAAVMSLCLLLPFSIWGLNIFNGRLASCTDQTSDWLSCLNEYEAQVFNWNVMSPNVYSNPLLHFDYFGQSIATLFEITSLEGWVDLLVNVMNITGVGKPPLSFASPINGVFVVFYNFIGIVFILTLFISVIIQNYSLQTGRAYMTVDQKSWYQVKNFLLQVKPSKRKNPCDLGAIQRFCYLMTIERNQVWLMLLNLVLFLHVLALLLEKYPSDNSLNNFRSVIYICASILFTCNATMLLIAQQPKVFFKYRWNVFSLVVSLGALVTTVIGFFLSAQSAFININKLFLVGTLFFVIPRSDRLSQFLRFATASLPNLMSLIFTWCVLFLVFAIALNQIFGTTKIGANGTNNLNLRTVPKALILLFRCSFGEGWNYIMDDYKLEQPFCTNNRFLGVTDCGNKQYAYILFFAWNIISMYIFLNMFISLILDSFSYIMNKGKYSKLIQRSEIRRFKKTWQLFDPHSTGFISPKQLPKLLNSLDGVLSFHFYHGDLKIPVLCSKWFKRLDISNPYDIEVNYNEIEKSFQEWDISKIRERRKSYEMFIEEALLNMELNKEPGISFRRILLQLPLYNTFEAGTCLNLIDFLERTLLLQKVEKRLHQNRVYETITAYICRWKYVENKKKGIRSDNIKFDTQLKRRSYLTGDRSLSHGQSLDNEFEHDFGDAEVKPVSSLTNDKGKDNDDDNSDDNDSGVYVPASPLNVFKRTMESLKSDDTTDETTGLLK